MKIIKFFYNIFEGACDYLSSPTHDLHVSPTKKLEREIIELKKQLEEAYELKLYSRRKLEQENKMMRECIEFVIANSGTSTNYNLKCREILSKLTKDEK